MEVLILSFFTPMNHLAHSWSVDTPLWDHCNQHGEAVKDIIYFTESVK